MSSPSDLQHTAFPAKSKTAVGSVNGQVTTVSTISFTDRILITISQAGKLSHWIHVPLSSATADPMNPGIFQSSAGDPSHSLLPRSELTATTIFGGTKREDEIVGQTLATTIASAILMQRPSEERMLVLGIGLDDVANFDREVFENLVGLVLDCL